MNGENTIRSAQRLHCLPSQQYSMAYITCLVYKACNPCDESSVVLVMLPHTQQVPRYFRTCACPRLSKSFIPTLLSHISPIWQSPSILPILQPAFVIATYHLQHVCSSYLYQDEETVQSFSSSHLNNPPSSCSFFRHSQFLSLHLHASALLIQSAPGTGQAMQPKFCVPMSRP